MVSLIQSNYNRFRSGIAVLGTGITLQDRGANFSLDPESDNYLEGGKKPTTQLYQDFWQKMEKQLVHLV